ncbi:MAG: hypothetical protein ACKV2T_19845 [Kofleriaceae bacterium]
MFVRLAARVALVHIALGAAASADDVPTDGAAPIDMDDDLVVRESRSLFHDPGKPLLELDITPRPNLVGLGVVEDSNRTAISLGTRATLVLTGASWTGYADAVPIDGNENDLVRGSRAAIGLRYDLGWAQIDAEVSQNTMSSSLGSGRYRDATLMISKSHAFSRSVTGWIGLSFGHRRWEGTPPAGEAPSSWALMLMLGLTF